MILDRSSAVPLYFQIHQHLLEQIHSGALQPGQLLPSEQEIASSLGVSRMTARQAVKSLCDAGVAYSRRGLGTFVSGSKREKTSTELLSFTQEMKARGCRPGARVLAFEEIGPEAEVARALHLGAKAKVLRLKRVRTADAEPMSIEESFLPAKLFPGLLTAFSAQASLYEMLSERYGIRMSGANEVVEASLAGADEARLLGVNRNSPVFVLTRICYAESGPPVEFVRSTYRGDRWKIVSWLAANQSSGAHTQFRSSPSLTLADARVAVPNHRSKRRAQSGSARRNTTSEERS